MSPRLAASDHGHMDLVPLVTTGFTPLGVTHLATLLVFFIGIWPVVAWGRRVRGTEAEAAACRMFALAIPCFTIPMQLIDLTPGRFDLDTSLPLQLCDFAWMAAVAALWTRRRFCVGLTYFWGLSLTTQAMITPDLVSDFPDPKFLGFWGMHMLIVWAAIFLVWGLGLAPRWNELRSTVLTTVVWLALVFAINSAAGTNYGFVNRKPARATVLDYFGPWPTYVLVEILIVAVVWALMTAPWEAARRRSEGAAKVAAC
jgi:hypothetical integral membrane protein (TIGR02206 family)